MAHELGRQYVEKNMPNVQASYIESVPEGADSERVITQLASQGNKVIFTTTLVIWTRRSTSQKIPRHYLPALLRLQNSSQRRQLLRPYV